MFDEDLSVFYDADEFATEFTLVGSSPALTFAGIVGEVDEDALDGFVTGVERQLRWPTASASLTRDQRLSVPSGPHAGSWRVLRDGRMVNDGRESVTFIAPA